MTIQSELQKASFRGVVFLWTSTTINGGRKTVTHEFPNKDTRFTEDLGRLPKSFSIEATISNINYKQNRDTLIAALEKKGSAALIHPTLGSFQVQVLTYTLSEDITDLGNAKFSINFEKTEANIFPEISTDNTPAIVGDAETVFNQTEDNIANNYESPANKFVSYEDSLSKVTSFTDTAKSAASDLRQIATKINEFSNSINTLLQDINAIIVAPAQLAASIINIITLGQNLFEVPNDVFTYYQSLFDYGDDDIESALITEGRIFRQNNRNILNVNVRTAALAGAYQSIVNLEFITIDDVETYRTLLEDQYLSIIENELINYDTKDLLQTLRNEAEFFLQQQEKIVLNEKQIRVYNEPITTLTYRMYGDLERIQDIIDLNDVDNYSFLDGEINILSE